MPLVFEHMRSSLTSESDFLVLGYSKLDRLVFKIGFIDQFHDFSVTVEDRRSKHPNWSRGTYKNCST